MESEGLRVKKLYAIGEALIDFIPQESGVGIAEVGGFEPHVGGAPANVCGAYQRLGGESGLITQLGQDPFGDKIQGELESFGIDCRYVERTEEANTSLAFVALKADGNREFVFYRKPGADMLYKEEQLKEEMFQDAYALHFCSVSLGNFPMKDAHKVAISYARKQGALISFDPNLRFNLWADEKDLYNAVQEFLPLADVLKVSDEELEFLTGETDIEAALPKLMQGEVKLVIYTEGADGARAFTKTAKGYAAGKKVKAVDTTGAGDAFIGSFLYQLSEKNVHAEGLSTLSEEELSACLEFSNTYCAKSVQKKGAISSYPTGAEMR